MHIVFRVDASTTIGTGHVVRCLTLADALQSSGHSCQFICRRHENHLGARIEQHGYRLTLLEPDSNYQASNELPHADWLGTSWQNDADDCIAALSGRAANWLVVDHYALDSRWENRMRPHADFVMAIDDLADRKHDIDLLLDQNYYPDMAGRYDALVDADADKLIGPRYAMLREEFIAHREQADTRKQIENILVFFGGGDHTDLIVRALQAIQQTQTPATITVIVGNSNPDTDNLRQICESMELAECHRSVDNMAELMAKADLAIGAGGTTTWERCYLGLPAIVVTLADNQKEVNEAVVATGACIQAGGTDANNHEFAELIVDLIEAPDLLTAASEAAFAVMQDHVGTAGIVASMEHIHGRS